MPVYEVAAPDGRKFSLEGDSPPTEADLDEVFKAAPTRSQQPAAASLDTDALNRDAAMQERSREYTDSLKSAEFAKNLVFDVPREVGHAAGQLVEPLKPFLEKAVNTLIPGASEIPSGESLILPPLPPEKKGFGPSLYRQAEGLTTKEGVGMLAAAPESELVKAAFLLPALAGTVQGGADLATAKTGDERLEALGNIVGQGTFAGLLGRGKGKPGEVPETVIEKGAKEAEPVPPVEPTPTSLEAVPEPIKPAEAQGKWTSATASEADVPAGVKPPQPTPAPTTEPVTEAPATREALTEATSRHVERAPEPTTPTEPEPTPLAAEAAPEQPTVAPIEVQTPNGKMSFLLSKNTAVGQERTANRDPSAERFGGKDQGEMEGPWRVTVFQNGEPMGHSSFDTIEQAKSYQEFKSEAYRRWQPTVAEPQSAAGNVPKPQGSIGEGIKAALEKNKGSEAGFINLDPLRDFLDRSGVTPAVRASIEAVREAGKEAFTGKKMTDYRRSVLNWSMKLQRSFQEAYDSQREIKTKVPDPIRREGITNWIQADGDAVVLRSRAASSNPKLRPGYEAALTLTPEEIAVAREVKAAYDTFGHRANRYGILNTFKNNYVTQIWDLGRRAPTGGATSRTLKDKFRFSKASTFPTFFDGEQAGFTPKTKDISKLLPVYIHEMNSVIAARQLVEQMAGGVASDGRPLLMPKGVGVPIEDVAGNREATLIMPNASKGDTTGYRKMENQPALSDWRWAAKDADGKPIFMKGDLVVHPEAADRFKAVLGKSAISEWYNSKTSAGAAIPKALVKVLDLGQGEVKRTMLGLFAPFHQVQEGTHAVGHRVNPFFNIPKIDLIRDAAQADAAKHGLMLLPDRASEGQFMEGFRHSGLVSRIPGIGPAADFYSHYLFHEYIPGLKYKTYQAILERNTKVFESNLRSGEVKMEDVKVLSAEQANAAYGHLNYADLGRNPTIQHMMRLGLLAPDFLEARGRFAGQAIKGLTGAKVGREQLLALATLAVAQAALAYTGAKATGGEWDAKHPFEFVKNNRRYTMRSVPEDAFRLVTDSRAFIYARLNPIIGRGAVQYLSGVDWRGQKKTALETTKELAQAPVPLTARGFLGIGNTPLNQWEQLASAVGLKISRYSAQNDVYQKIDEFKKHSKDPKLVAEFERRQKETMADSDYKPLRDALEKGDTKEAKAAYAELLKTKKPDVINRAMQPYTVSKIPGTDYWDKHTKPFTGSKLVEQRFVKSLSPEEKKIYEKAKAEREAQYQKFKAMLKKPQ